MENMNVLYIALGFVALIGLLLAWHQHRIKKMREYVAYRQAMLSRNVMAMSHVLLSSLESHVAECHKETIFKRDERFSISHDRGSAHAVVAVFMTWYNIAVAPAVDMTPIFEDIMITKLDRVDTDKGTWVMIHLGQGNDVIKHFLPDHGLQTFITSVRGLSSYMQQGVNAQR
jgi:hypothetical protein